MAYNYKKARRPERLANNDYENFTAGLIQWGEDHKSDPDFYPNYADIPPLKAAFDLAYQEYVNSMEVADEKLERFNESGEALFDIMMTLRRMLPALFGNDQMLDDFSLRDALSTDIDKLLIRARQCKDQWDIVKAQPEYAPLIPQFDEFLTILAACESARQVEGQAVLDREQAQNETLTTRDACHDEERRMFNWYRGLYTSPQDEWWTETPWGKSPGKSDDDAFPAPKMLMYDQFRNDFSWEQVSGATGYELEIINKTTQETITIETTANQKRQELAKGDYAVKVRAVKVASDKTYSKWGGDVLFTIAAAPANFKYDAPTKKLKWNIVVGANIYEVRKDGSFDPIYLGADTEFVLDLPAGQYQFRVRGGNDAENWWGQWSEILIVNV